MANNIPDKKEPKTLVQHMLLKLIAVFFYVLQFTPAYAIEVPSLYFSNLRQEDGLPSNITSSVVQDQKEFIWIGTANGVCRYDGYTTIVFKNDGSPNSLPTNNISSLLIDGDTLWVGTWKGLCKINTKTLEISRVNLGPDVTIRCLYKSMDNKIWIGTSNGLLAYSKELNKFDFFNDTNSELSHSTIRCFYETKDGSLWIGTYNKLNRFKNGKFESFNLKGDYKPYLKNNLILDICPFSETNDSILYVGTETGLAVFNTNSFKHQLYNSSNTSISNEVVKCIYTDEDKLWLGTDFGLSIFDMNLKCINTYFHNPIINHSITNNVVWDIFRDSSNTLWFLTSNGISLINKENPFFKLHEEFYSVNNQKAGNQIRDILVTEDETMYMATIHGVIIRDPHTNKKTYFTADAKDNKKLLLDNAYALAEDPYGCIWIGTAGGINVWNPKLQVMKSISANKSNGLTSNYISSFAISKDGSVWVNAWEGGIFKLTGNMQTLESIHFTKVEDSAPDFIYACNENIYYSKANKLWTINNKTLATEPVREINKFINNQSVSCMNASKDESIWMATENQLIHYTPKLESIVSYPLNNPVIGDPISIETDQENNIWMAGLTAVIKYEVRTGAIISMPLNPHYPLKNFYSQCSAISTSGKVYFGGDNGYVEANTNTEDFQPACPKSVISAIKVNNDLITSRNHSKLLEKDIAYTDKISLTYSNNSLTFFFSTLNYWLPQKSHFRYRLNNLDTDWHSTQNVNFAAYSNLKPGNYNLEVEAINYAGIQSKTTTKLAVVIQPPLWLSNPFIVLYLLLCITVVYSIFKLYAKRQKLNNQLRIANLEKNHSEEILNTKQQFFTNISHEFRTPLSLITPPIQQVLKSGALQGKNLEMLKLAEKNSKRLLTLINQILDFRKLESQTIPLLKRHIELTSFCEEIFDSFKDMASRNEVNYTLTCGIAPVNVILDKEKIEAILFNLLINAFKHTPPEGSIEMSVDIVNDENRNKIKISVSDTGSGIPADDISKIFDNFYQSENNPTDQQGTGIGLSMAKQYAGLHQGNICVKSKTGLGSTFTFTFPLEEGELITAEQPQQTNTGSQTAILKQLPPNKDLKHILIVDDNPDILDYIEMNLETDYCIHKASNGSKGFDLTVEVKPEIIISDIMMPVMDGIEMCKKIKQNTSTKQIPIILLTAKTLDIQKTEGIEVGANMYITKPFDINYLKACINNIVSRKEQLHDFIKKELLINPLEENNPDRNQDEQFLKKVMEFISENISNPDLSVEMISSKMNLSSTHLYRKLKAITNQSTKDILKNYRLQKAAQMIKNNEGNITEIMYSVGFNSLSGFSKSFKSIFGVSPSEYGKLE
ncbi:two-component regulator propeller domain-containing protein [Labilibaculum sp.]|uniref:two-component regulator propeller domain-containing protein n=1 Tax=Labilibaculum sp. TaxID=2060723 RepID=UPI002AA74AE4|nr:two-component regulator propeller domain-containing protein [Labilibaculum sp.]